MNKTQWLTSSDGEALLDFVADRLSPRQWVLLAAAHTRRLWDFLPEGVLRQAIDRAERAEHPLSACERADWQGRIEAAGPEAVAAAELAQLQIVRSCDPDAADLDAPILSRPNQLAPAFPLFQAASRHARQAVEWIADAVAEAVRAIHCLYGPPGEEMLGRVRSRVEEAGETRTAAVRAANSALRLKAKGDEIADHAAGAKNKRLYESIALEEVRKIEEGSFRRGEADHDGGDRRDRAARKLLAAYLRDIVGNPFAPPRFDPAWRTATVVSLARGIFEDRAFDRLPILADALLDADCDCEALLRHCRGTEPHAKEAVTHVRGCWVVEMVLQRYEPLPPPRPGKKPVRRRRARDPFLDLDLSDPFDRGDDRLA
jgi:hypothetical protein